MRYIKYGLIILGVLILLVLIWFFKPEASSSLKGNLYEDSYLAGTVKTGYLWKSPFTTIISSIPGGAASVPHIPFFLKPLIPPTAEFYVLKNKEGGGWAAAIDLGWRSKLFRKIHDLIMEQMQYRGFGAIEKKNILRTPAGLKILVYQDNGTLFIGEGESVIKGILYPVHGPVHGPVHEKDTGINVTSSQGLMSQISDSKDIAYMLFLNNGMEVSDMVKGLERDKGFLVFSSVNSLRGGSVKIRRPGSDTVVAELSLMIQDNGDISGVDNDLAYLLDLFDRLLSTNNLKVDKTINKEKETLTVQVMIHPVGGPK